MWVSLGFNCVGFPGLACDCNIICVCVVLWWNNVIDLSLILACVIFDDYWMIWLFTMLLLWSVLIGVNHAAIEECSDWF